MTLSAVTRAPLVSYNGAIAGLHELGPEFMKVFVLPHNGKCYVKNVNRTSVPMLSQDHAGNGWAEHEHDRGEFSLIFFPIYYGFIRRFEVQSAYFLVTKATLELLKSVHFVNYIKI